MGIMKTTELSGAALDWAVAKCEGIDLFETEGWVYDDDGRRPYKPSTNWAQGGPLLEREDISFRKYHNPKSETHGTYYARVCRENGTRICWYKTTGFQSTGPTPLIAAMRCYVASKLGDEIEIPEALL